MKFSATVLLVLACTGCANFTSPGRFQQLEDSKPYWFDYGVERRGAVLIPMAATNNKPKRIFMCSEPVPRVVATLKLDSEGKVSGTATPQNPNTSAEAKVKSESGGTTVNEETMVLFLREALYRLCELSVNLDSIDPNQQKIVLDLYTSVVNAAVNLSGKTEPVQLAQLRAKSIEQYLDVLGRFEKSTADAARANSQAQTALQLQLTNLRAQLSKEIDALREEVKKVPPPGPQGSTDPGNSNVEAGNAAR